MTTLTTITPSITGSTVVPSKAKETNNAEPTIVSIIDTL